MLMNVGIHGKIFDRGQEAIIQSVFEKLNKGNTAVYVSDKFNSIISNSTLEFEFQEFSKNNKINELDILITLGGDGTLLEAISYIGNRGIPVLGINTGRMGFLATTAKEEIDTAIEEVLKNDFKLDTRTLLSLNSNADIFSDNNYALNDFTILKKDTSSMITVHAFVDGEFLNSYWADGLIVSTPTGSTGYSLSCGGPLILPESSSFVITPVSPHNLTTRPMIVPDNCEISFRIEGRSENFLVSLDSRFETVNSQVQLKLRKAEFCAHLVKLKNSSYFKTIRQKLHWGVDIRN